MSCQMKDLYCLIRCGKLIEFFVLQTDDDDYNSAVAVVLSVVLMEFVFDFKETSTCFLYLVRDQTSNCFVIYARGNMIHGLQFVLSFTDRTGFTYLKVELV